MKNKLHPEYEFAYAWKHEHEKRADALYQCGFMLGSEHRKIRKRIEKRFKAKRELLRKKGKIYA